MFDELKKRGAASALILSAFLAGCATIPWGRGATTEAAIADVTTATACGSFRRLDPSKRDTDGTLHQIHEHNAAYAALCEETTH